MFLYTENLQENIHAEVSFQQSCKATLLKSHFGLRVLLCCAAYFQNTPPKGCFCYFILKQKLSGVLQNSFCYEASALLKRPWCFYFSVNSAEIFRIYFMNHLWMFIYCETSLGFSIFRSCSDKELGIRSHSQRTFTQTTDRGKAWFSKKAHLIQMLSRLKLFFVSCYQEYSTFKYFFKRTVYRKL